MRNNLLRAAMVFMAFGTPIASASAAFAYAGDNYDYARDSWPQIQASMQKQDQRVFAKGPASITSDATPGAAVPSAPANSLVPSGSIQNLPGSGLYNQSRGW